MASIKDLIQKLQNIVTGTDTSAPSTGLDIERLKSARLAKTITTKIFDSVTLEDTIKRISLPSDIYSIFTSAWTLYQTVPEINQAVFVIVDNMLSPDSITKRSIRTITNVTDQQERETLERLVYIITEELELEDVIEELCTNFIVFGNAYVEIINNRPILKKYGLIEDNNLQFSFYDTYYDEENYPDENVPYLKEDILNYANTYGFNQTGLTNITSNIRPLLRYMELKILNPLTIIPIYIGGTLFGAFEIIKSQQQLSGYGGNANVGASANWWNDDNNQSTFIQRKKLFLNRLEPIIKGITDIIIRRVKTDEKFKNLIQSSDLIANLIANIIRENARLIERSRGIRFIPGDYFVHFKIPNTQFEPWGQPYLLGVLNHAKFLLASEYAQLVYRLTRAPERRVFRINIGQERRASKYIEDLIRETKRKEVVIRNGSIDALINEVTMFEDYYIPVRNGEPTFDIDTVPGGDLTSRIEDLDYFRKKVISGLGVPPIYLIQEETSESKYTLAQENVKFARTLIRLQKRFAVGLNDLLYKIFLMLFGAPDLIDRIQLQLKPPKAIQMEREAEIVQNLSTIVSTLKDIAGDKFDVDEITRQYLIELFDNITLREYSLDLKAKKLQKGEEGGEEI